MDRAQTMSDTSRRNSAVRNSHYQRDSIHVPNEHEAAESASVDLEKQEGVEPEDDKQYGEEDDDDDDFSDTSSVFSERHTEGPYAARRISSITRTTSQRLERVQTGASVALSVIRNRNHVPPFSHRLDHARTTPDVLVDFDGPDDPYRPMNWTLRKKAITTVLFGLTAMSTTFSSSIFSTGGDQIAREFHVGSEVSTLGTTVFLFGLGLGPLIFAPLSELYGRRLAVLTPVFVGAMFTFGVGAAENIQTVIICRFFAGFFGSAPVTNTGGLLSDIWTAQQRGSAMVLYTIAVTGGPTLGPLVGGAICDSSLGWRWTMYITGIFMGATLVADLLYTDESYAPVLLQRKAMKLRLSSGNWALHAKHEEWNPTLVDMCNKYLIVPFRLLSTPICFLVAMYSSFCYGLFYASLGSFPYVFQTLRGWNPVVGALPFLSLLIGILIGACGNFVNQRFYLKAMKANNGRPVPEARLPPMMLGTVVFTCALFVFAWTAKPSIHWSAPVISILFQGFGLYTIFQGALNYLIDTFQPYAASAVACNTFARSCFAGVFPLFIVQVLKALGPGWGLSIFGFTSTAMLPIPYLFYFYGKNIRAKSAWSRESV